MKKTKDTRQEISTLVRLDGMEVAADTLLRLAQRQKAREMVTDAIKVAQTHGFDGVRIAKDGGLYLVVHRTATDGDDALDVSLADSSCDGQADALLDDLSDWQKQYQLVLSRFPSERWLAVIENNLAVVDQDHWVRVAGGKTVFDAVDREIEARKRALRGGDDRPLPALSARRPTARP